MKSNLDIAWEDLGEAQEVAARKKAMSLQNIPLRVEERHGEFRAAGYVARSRVYTCLLCGSQRSECLGVFSREDHSAGGRRYMWAQNWPSASGMRHEVAKVDEPFCFACIQELGFDAMEDSGEMVFAPQGKYIELGLVKPTGTNRIIPRSVEATLRRFAERVSDRAALDVDEMLAELGDGTGLI